MNNKKIVFLGTPEFSACVLQGLIDAKYNIIAVVTQPDKEVGRKRIIEFRIPSVGCAYIAFPTEGILLKVFSATVFYLTATSPCMGKSRLRTADLLSQAFWYRHPKCSIRS